MTNEINYFIHKTYNPPYYHRQYEQDLPQKPEETSLLENSKRVTLLVIPFLSLYQPFGQIISLTMGSARVLSTSAAVITSDQLDLRLNALYQVALAALALVGALYQFTLGLYLTTVVDIISNLMTLTEGLITGDTKQVLDSLMQGVSSSLYLSIMAIGALEVILASILVQALLSFYQAQDEWKNGRTPEAFAKTLMGFIRLYQTNTQVHLLLRRNALLNRYSDLANRIQQGRKIDHLWDDTLRQQLEKGGKALLKDANGKEYDFGQNLYGYGSGLVKGMNVTWRQEGDRTILEFKVNHVFRERLEGVLKNLENVSQEDRKDLLKIFGSRIEDVTIEKKTVEQPKSEPADLSFFGTHGMMALLQSLLMQLLRLFEKDPNLFKDLFDDGNWNKKDIDGLGERIELHLKGLGKISIGGTKDAITLYDKVTIEMDRGKTLYDFHEALAFLQLDDALKQSSGEDILRMKMGHLFRILDPQAATLFEREDAFFTLSIEDLRREIFKRSPKMEGAFLKWLDKMALREMLPGQYRWAIPGLAEELREQGAYGLTAAMTGNLSHQELLERSASILMMGMLSPEQRHLANFNKNGLCWGAEYFTGGADSVFTQLATDKNKSYDEFDYKSPIRFIISLDALETGSYQYHGDFFGVRVVDPNHSSYGSMAHHYLERDNIYDFVSKEREHFVGNNELMLKYISAGYLRGMQVESEQLKQDLIAFYREKKIIQLDATGRETIFSKPVDDFIFVGNPVKKEHFDP